MVESEDLAQETFIQAFQQLETFRHEAKFSSWLYRIAVNLCLNWKKRDLRRQKAYEQWSGDKPSHTNSTENEQRNSQKVQEVMLKLDAKQRAAIILTFYDGLNHSEAARALGCSETTVSWRIFAARRKLKKWLQAC
jgi:RNA polymerase sigma-70 factor (ECF subfamily)